MCLFEGEIGWMEIFEEKMEMKTFLNVIGWVGYRVGMLPLFLFWAVGLIIVLFLFLFIFLGLTRRDFFFGT